MPLGNLVFKLQEGIIDKLGKKNMKALVYEDNLLVYEFPFTLSTGKLIKEYTLIKDVEKGEKFDLNQVAVKSELVHEETKLKNININEDTIYSEKLFAGTKLEDKHIESNSSVKKGDKIAIVVSFGTMKITDKGEALQKGNMGDLIEVKNLRTGKTLKGIVISKDTVEIAP
jgi:flagella basal body P-ring formation protein FlgA